MSELKMKGIDSSCSRHIRNWLLLATLSFYLLAQLCACAATPLDEIWVTLTPTAADVYITQSLQFTATVHNSSNGAVTWSLSGAGCSGPTCGTISNTGLYTAPANAPNPAIITVRATSAADTSKSASATITVLEASDVWIWISGSSTVNQYGIYGTKGIPALTNVPGARVDAVSWTDASSRLWLFGGYGYYPPVDLGSLNDLWKFDTTTLEWIWVSGSDVGSQYGVYGTKGTPALSNVPGGRVDAASWIDSSGNLWLFGGFGYASSGNGGSLNDLWKYNPTTLEWTWVSGSDTVDQAGIYGTKGISDALNIPGARNAAISWIDSNGNLWLFGGIGYDSAGGIGCLNDLWKYNPTAHEWTWVSGTDLTNMAGVYGTKGIAAPPNVPGARRSALSWIDSSGNLWVFGGGGYDSAGGVGNLNDLWKYDPITLAWTWVSGGNMIEQAGVYGTKGIADPLNAPGSREDAISWLDSSGDLWLFGGRGRDAWSQGGFLNDLWRFDPTTLKWTWVSGSNSIGQAGVYGTKGIPDLSNLPGARLEAISWLDSEGRLWLFGGQGRDSVGTFGRLNDLWRYSR